MHLVFGLKAKFKILDEHTAIENGIDKTPKAPPNTPTTDEPEETFEPRSKPEPTRTDTKPPIGSSGLDEYIKRRKFERKITDTLHRHNVST